MPAAAAGNNATVCDPVLFSAPSPAVPHLYFTGEKPTKCAENPDKENKSFTNTVLTVRDCCTKMMLLKCGHTAKIIWKEVILQ